jgi:hypothetical protein
MLRDSTAADVDVDMTVFDAELEGLELMNGKDVNEVDGEVLALLENEGAENVTTLVGVEKREDLGSRVPDVEEVSVDDGHVGLADNVELEEGHVELVGVEGREDMGSKVVEKVTVDDGHVGLADKVELDEGHVTLVGDDGREDLGSVGHGVGLLEIEMDGVVLENEREAATLPATVADDVNEFAFKLIFAVGEVFDEGFGGFGKEGTRPVDAISTSKYSESAYNDASASVHMLSSIGTPGAEAKLTGITDDVVPPARDDRESTVVVIANSVFSRARKTEGTAPNARKKDDAKIISSRQIMILSKREDRGFTLGSKDCEGRCLRAGVSRDI